MDRIVIWGASGHARVVADIIRLNGEYEIVGFLDSVDSRRHLMAYCGSQILGGEEQLTKLQRQGINHLIFGFGNCAARLRLTEVVKLRGYQLTSAIYPNSAIASDVIIGPGTVVAAGSVINSGSLIGENVIINTSSSVDHECIIENGVHIGPGVRLGGKVNIGLGTWVGIGATVIDHINIGSGSLIGAGSVVVNDIPDNVVAYGNPAKVKRQVRLDETF